MTYINKFPTLFPQENINQQQLYVDNVGNLYDSLIMGQALGDKCVDCVHKP